MSYQMQVGWHTCPPCPASLQIETTRNICKANTPVCLRQELIQRHPIDNATVCQLVPRANCG